MTGIFVLCKFHADVLDLSQFQPYDVADVLRHFYRDLPECLLTDRISSLCLAVYRCTLLLLLLLITNGPSHLLQIVCSMRYIAILTVM
jgi:hypothetical protein